ncbi:hypothetical protein ACFFJT_16985 [Dyella flava]|uniref:Uncharacterized protein n=1 Tax=Dyella flava TaxID=1920170 RepID=A0ABS2K3F2_9GAMM|nr:hypothetical protein [Dyella flava]MBM7125778.1 hypothetical protein [Dyella flava]
MARQGGLQHPDAAGSGHALANGCVDAGAQGCLHDGGKHAASPSIGYLVLAIERLQWRCVGSRILGMTIAQPLQPGFKRAKVRCRCQASSAACSVTGSRVRRTTMAMTITAAP